MATDSNADLVCQLTALPGAVDQLSALVRGADIAHVTVSTAMRVQAAGVLVNVAGLSTEMATARNPEAQAELSRLVLPLLLEQMVYDPAVLQQACVTLAAAAPAETKPTAKSMDAEKMDVDGGTNATIGDGACAIGVAGEEGGVDIMEDAEAGAAAGAQVVAAVAASTPMQMATGEVFHEGKGGEQPVSEGSLGGVQESGGKEGEGGEEAIADQPDMDAQARWGWKLAVAEPLKLTAEVLTNLCSLAAGEEEEGDGDEEEWGSDDEDAMELAASGGVQGPNANGQTAGGTGRSPVVLLDAMVERAALPRTVAALQALLSRTPRDHEQHQQPTGVGGGGAAGTPTPSEQVGALSPKSDHLPLPAGTAADLADLRATVALCAANLVQNLPPRALGQNPHVLWTDLCSMCEAAMERAPSCVETLTGVMWGLARSAGPAVAGGIRSIEATAGAGTATATVTAPGARADPTVTDSIPLLLRLCDPEVTRSFEARVNAVGMLGALGSAAAIEDESSEAARQADVRLGRALVQAMEDPHVLVQAEALNAVMDVYGEDGRDAAFRETGAPAALVEGMPAFRRKVKQEGGALGRDALCHLKETALNGSRFVKYKQIALEGTGPGR